MTAIRLASCEEVTACREDGVVRVDGATRIRGEGPYLADHFPGFAVFPGVFIVETVVQAVARALGDRDGHRLRWHTLRSLRLLAPLHPGDRLLVRAEVREPGPAPEPDRPVIVAECRRAGGGRVATMTVTCRWSA